MTAGAPPNSEMDPGPEKFVYRPIPTSAPVAAVLAALALCGPVTLYSLGISPTAITFWTMICLLAGILGFNSLRKIRRAQGSLSGDDWAKGAVLVAAGAALTNAAVAAILIAGEIPEGYQVLNFTRDISQKKLGAQRTVHPDVEALDGKPIFLKGYMYRDKRRQEGLRNFILVKDNQQCCFGRQPNESDMIEIRMKGDTTVDLELGLTAVAGVFRASNPSPRTEMQFKPVYRIEAEICKPAKVAF